MKFVDTCVEALRPRFQIHGALECEDGEGSGEAGAEVHHGVSGERAACAVGEDQGLWGVGRGERRRILMTLDRFLDEFVYDGQGRDVVGFRSGVCGWSLI